MAKDTSVASFKNQIEECLATPIEELISNSAWGSINFEDIKDDIQKLFDMLNHFKVLPISILPEAEIAKLSTELGRPRATIAQIKNFTIEQQDPKGIRDSIAKQLVTQIDNFYTIAHIWIPYLAYQKGEVQSNIKSLNDSVKKATKIVDDAKKDVDGKKAEIDSVVLAAKEASASVGVGHFSSNFQDEAESLKDTSKKWLITTGILAGLTLGITLLLYWILPIGSEATVPQIVQVLSTKVIVITIFFTATLWAGKMYKATMHQMIVNKHRANSLRTFQAFIKASNETSTRDAVLMETTKSIFSLVPSGYIDNENSGSKNTSIVEVVKSSSDLLKNNKND